MHLTAWAAEVWDGQSQRKGPAYLGQQDAIFLHIWTTNMALFLLLKSMWAWPKPREQLKLRSVTASTRERIVRGGHFSLEDNWLRGEQLWIIFHTFPTIRAWIQISNNHLVPHKIEWGTCDSAAPAEAVILAPLKYICTALKYTQVYIHVHLHSSQVHLHSCHPWDIGLHTNSLWSPFSYSTTSHSHHQEASSWLPISIASNGVLPCTPW